MTKTYHKTEVYEVIVDPISAAKHEEYTLIETILTLAEKQKIETNATQ